MQDRSALTAADVEAARTPAGGYTRATLESWGIPWPPPAGWKARLLDDLEPTS